MAARPALYRHSTIPITTGISIFDNCLGQSGHVIPMTTMTAVLLLDATTMYDHYDACEYSDRDLLIHKSQFRVTLI